MEEGSQNCIFSGFWLYVKDAELDWCVGDFNGDGKDDIFNITSDELDYDVFISNGSGFIRDKIWFWEKKGNSTYIWNVGDFNGDGRDDISRDSLDNSEMEVFLSNGSNFKRDTSWRERDIKVDLKLLELTTYLKQGNRCGLGYKHYVNNPDLLNSYFVVLKVEWGSGLKQESQYINITLEPGQSYYLGCNYLPRLPIASFKILEEKKIKL